MAAFSAFRPYVTPDVPGCPQVMVDDAIVEACRTFASETWLITYDVPVFSTVVDTQSYVLIPPAQHEVFGIGVVIKNGVLPPLTPTTDDAALRYVVSSGSPSAYWFRSDKMWVCPTPDQIDTINAEALIRPLQAATEVDDQFLEFREAVSCWAKYKLMMMAGKPWYSPGDAKENYATYKKLSGEGQIRASSGRVAAQLRVSSNFF